MPVDIPHSSIGQTPAREPVEMRVRGDGDGIADRPEEREVGVESAYA